VPSRLAADAAAAVRRVGIRRLLLVFCLLCLLQPLLAAQDVPIPAAPDRWVTDTAGFLPPGDADRLNERLRTYEAQTQHQLLVWIGQTTGEVPIEDWANRAFEQWRVGREGIDDGLVLFIMAEDRRLRIEVGYGLEPDVPDLLASRIIEETIVPRIRAGDNAGAVNAGMEAVANAIGTPLPGAGTPVRDGSQARPLTLGQLIFYAIIGLIFLSILATNPSLATWLLISFLSGGGRRRGGGGFGGGGFRGGGGWRGGGGMSGGGGASGSW
jgi:uncharacterized protein